MLKTITTIAATLALFIGVAQARTKTVKVAAFVPEKSVGVAKVIKPWMQAVQNDAGNAVRMQGFWGGTLGKSPTKQYELVKNGVADVSWVLPGYTAGQFPQMGVFELPFLFHNAVEASRVGWMLYKQGLLKGLEDVHLVGFFATEPNALFMRTPIANLGDLANKKIRSAGAIQAKWLEELKAAPQTLPSTAMNEALDRGTLDGVVQGWTGMKTFKTLPLVRQAYIVPVGVIPFLLVMNKNTWNSLPKSVQASIMKHGGDEMAMMGGKAYAAEGAKIKKAAKASGKIAIEHPTSARMAQYEKQINALYEWWAAKTPNGKKVLDATRAALKQIRG
jgi:TRAP-type C4-dicarboxylate transport system substrate-binding protein